MATAQSEYQKFMSRNVMKHYDVDPSGDTTAAFDVAWVDMRDYEGFIASFFRTVGTDALDTFSIIANSESDGGGTDATIIVGMPAAAEEPNAVGDQIFIECSAEQLASLSTSATGKLRYVSISIEFATGTDEAVVTYVRYGTRNAKDGLTANIVA